MSIVQYDRDGGDGGDEGRPVIPSQIQTPAVYVPSVVINVPFAATALGTVGGAMVYVAAKTAGAVGASMAELGIQAAGQALAVGATAMAGPVAGAAVMSGAVAASTVASNTILATASSGAAIGGAAAGLTIAGSITVGSYAISGVACLGRWGWRKYCDYAAHRAQPQDIYYLLDAPAAPAAPPSDNSADSDVVEPCSATCHCSACGPIAQKEEDAFYDRMQQEIEEDKLFFAELAVEGGVIPVETETAEETEGEIKKEDIEGGPPPVVEEQAPAAVAEEQAPAADEQAAA